MTCGWFNHDFVGSRTAAPRNVMDFMAIVYAKLTGSNGAMVTETDGQRIRDRVLGVNHIRCTADQSKSEYRMLVVMKVSV